MVVSATLLPEQQKYTLDLLFPSLLALLDNCTLRTQHPGLVVTLTLVLKDLVISCHASMSREQQESIGSLVLSLCQLSVPESCCLYLGNLIMLYSHYLNQDNLEESVLKALATRVFKCRNPSIA